LNSGGENSLLSALFNTPAASEEDSDSDSEQNNGEMHLSDKGLKFLERHETINGKPDLKAKPDIYGNPTIGYGHMVKPGEDLVEG
jgi:hypothetical protein